MLLLPLYSVENVADVNKIWESFAKLGLSQGILLEVCVWRYGGILKKRHLHEKSVQKFPSWLERSDHKGKERSVAYSIPGSSKGHA